ncbi:MAG: RIP metalloprotease [Alphaproteobacteria bacterium]|jgi:regulator of sigma E protease|nr:RIP metalloprotease [Alphaproteobacteria bacterium]MDP6817543.1 RIP metalloprotease [Alphaproteobacteria bacterium]
MDKIIETLNYIWPFLAVITPVVFFHELGHYLVARANKVSVEVFSIGFGPELFGINDRHGTRWKFSLLPLGGYVKFLGDANAASTTPAQDNDEMSDEEKAKCFHNKSVGQRSAVAVAGPIANFILAIIIFAILFATVGQQFTPAIVGAVIEDSAAQEAGLKSGDEFLQINGQEVSRFEDIQATVLMNLGEVLDITVLRDGEELTLQAAPRIVAARDTFGNETTRPQLGISVPQVAFTRHDPGTAIWQALKQTAFVISASGKAVGQMIAGSRSTEDLGGPIRIAVMSSQVAAGGITGLAFFLAVISISLGLINLVPIPVLDGGHLLFNFFEALMGRPLKPQIQQIGQTVGLALIIALMVWVTGKDIFGLAS